MKLECFALGFTLIAAGLGGFDYLDGQLAAQMASYEAGGGFLYSAEMTGLMEKVRLGLFVTALAGVAIAGFGATGRLKSGRSRSMDLETSDRAFCMHCGRPGTHRDIARHAAKDAKFQASLGAAPAAAGTLATTACSVQAADGSSENSGDKLCFRKGNSLALPYTIMSNVCACRHGRDAHRWNIDADDPEPCTMCGCPTFRDEDEERKW